MGLCLNSFKEESISMVSNYMTVKILVLLTLFICDILILTFLTFSAGMI